jgi:hypothetical protein
MMGALELILNLIPVIGTSSILWVLETSSNTNSTWARIFGHVRCGFVHKVMPTSVILPEKHSPPFNTTASFR